MCSLEEAMKKTLPAGMTLREKDRISLIFTQEALAEMKSELEKANSLLGRNPEPKKPKEDAELLSPSEYVHLVKVCELYLERKIGTAPSTPERKFEFVNALRYTKSDKVTRTQLHDDLVYVILTGPNGQTYRALLDTGATISAVAERVTESAEKGQWLDSFENKERVNEREVVYANSERGETGRTFENVTFTFGSSQETKIPTLYGMPLPPGIDILLGLDWFRRENPDVDWETGQLKGRKRSLQSEKPRFGTIAQAQVVKSVKEVKR